MLQRVDSQTRELQTITRAGLRRAVYHRIPRLSRAEVGRLVDLVFSEIVDALRQGETVGLRSFGKFTVREKRARPGRNPRTRKPAEIVARRVIQFKPSIELVREINREL